MLTCFKDNMQIPGVYITYTQIYVSIWGGGPKTYIIVYVYM